MDDAAELDRKAQLMIGLIGFTEGMSDAAKTAALQRLAFSYLQFYLDSTCRNLQGVKPEHDYSCFVLRRAMELLKPTL